MHIGFTGTREGMTEEQREEVGKLLSTYMANSQLLTPAVFHHGLCVGADYEAHQIAKQLGYVIVGHPPSNPVSMVDVECDIKHAPQAYLVRNHKIVDESEMLIVAPESHIEELRSGTWSTYRYARKLGKKVNLVLPSGRVVVYG